MGLGQRLGLGLGLGLGLDFTIHIDEIRAVVLSSDDRLNKLKIYEITQNNI